MLDKVCTKIRSLIEDLSQSDFEIFEYANSSIFTLAESNISSITRSEEHTSELQSHSFISYAVFCLKKKKKKIKHYIEKKENKRLGTYQMNNY